MSLSQDVRERLEKIGSLSMTSLAKSSSGEMVMHSRIISVCGSDEENIYFLTMDVKPFYRQLSENPAIALCGIYPSGMKTGKNAVGQPTWPPGYTFRVTGEVREIPEDEVKAKAEAGDKIHQYFLEDASRYPAMRFFTIHKGKGEVFDYDFEKENRRHKLERFRFSFGGETFNDGGARINPDDCIACGECYEACTFDAIVQGEPHSVDPSRCDECGSCSQVCPQDAVMLSHVI